MHGTIDRMITVPHGEILAAELGGVEAGVTITIMEDMGHVIMMEKRAEFKRLIEALIEKTSHLCVVQLPLN